MTWEYEMKAYLREIDKHLGQIEKPVKRSILKEIEDHLLQKVEDTKSEFNGNELTSYQFRKLLITFGDPKEIAKEYRRTVPRKSQIKKAKRRIKPWIPFVSSLIVIILLLGIIWYPTGDDKDKENDDETILEMPEGPWFQSIDWGDQWGDGGAVAVSENDGVFAYNGNTLFNLSNYPDGEYTGVAWHPTDSIFIVVGSYGTIMLSNMTGEHDISIPIYAGFQEVSFNPSGDYAIAVGDDGILASINKTNVSYRYIPDNVTETSLYDIAWDPHTGSALMIGFESDSFLTGSIIEFTPGINDTLNGSFIELDLPSNISTCFGIKWIEEWDIFFLLCNRGQIYTIDANRTFTRLDNPHTGLAPIMDAVYLPNEDKVLIVGGNAGWDSYARKYRLEWSSRYVLTYDGVNLDLVDSGLGPHLQVCEWSPINEHAIMLGAFGSSWIYQNGTVTDIEIESNINTG